MDSRRTLLLMIPAHFHDVKITDNKMKSNLVKIMQEHTCITLNQIIYENSY